MLWCSEAGIFPQAPAHILEWPMVSLLNYSRTLCTTPRALSPTPVWRERRCSSNSGLLLLPVPRLKLYYPHQTKLGPALEDSQISLCDLYRSPLDSHLLFVYVIFKDVIIIRTTDINTLGTNIADAQGGKTSALGCWRTTRRPGKARFTGRMENSHPPLASFNKACK